MICYLRIGKQVTRLLDCPWSEEDIYWCSYHHTDAFSDDDHCYAVFEVNGQPSFMYIIYLDNDTTPTIFVKPREVQYNCLKYFMENNAVVTKEERKGLKIYAYKEEFKRIGGGDYYIICSRGKKSYGYKLIDKQHFAIQGELLTFERRNDILGVWDTSGKKRKWIPILEG